METESLHNTWRASQVEGKSLRDSVESLLERTDRAWIWIPTIDSAGGEYNGYREPAG